MLFCCWLPYSFLISISDLRKKKISYPLFFLFVCLLSFTALQSVMRGVDYKALTAHSTPASSTGHCSACCCLKPPQLPTEICFYGFQRWKK